MKVKPIPEGYHTVTPYIVVKDAPALIKFLEKAFNAHVSHSTILGNGTVMNAEVRVGTSMVMIAEAPANRAPTGSMFYLYVEDVDAVYQQAVAAGGESIMEPTDMFYGDRNAGVKDASGNQWWIATHIKDVPEEEMQKLAEARGK